MRFARRRTTDAPTREVPPKAAPRATPPVAAAPRDRRQVSGRRVLCRCSLELPKLDPFSVLRTKREGYMVLNVRGGSLYLAVPFTLEQARRAFPDDRRLPVKQFTLYPEGGEPVEIGDLHVRFLKILEGRLGGMVLRFVGLDERQIELLNALRDVCPAVTGNEEDRVPVDELRQLK